MTRSLNPAGLTTAAADLAPDVARLAREVELTQLMETCAYLAQQWYGASYLVVDRTTHPATADVKVVLDATRLVDLWDLNPILWDDAHWAAIRSLEVGEVRIIQPALHRD